MADDLLKQNLDSIRSHISRSGKEVIFIAVTKNHPVETIIQAISLGITDIGENRVQEAEEKFKSIGNKVKWHMMGHLQTNKVKNAVKIFDMIQSVDSIRLAEEIDKRCKTIGKVMPILIEVNVAGEEQKYGAKPDEVLNLIKEVSTLQNVKVQGLMGVMPNLPSEQVRPHFKRLKLLFDYIKNEMILNVEMKHLSMGMSNDYIVAVQEGSNMVRLGTIIFGERK